MKRLFAIATASLLLTALAQPAFAGCDHNDIAKNASFEALLSDALTANQLKVRQEINLELQHSLWLQSVAMLEEVPVSGEQSLAQSIARVEGE